nr:uncharacterized protein LOC117846255 isoform X1 [Setaria viridis]
MKEAAANYLCRKSGNAKLDDNTPQLPNLHDYINKAINLTNALRLSYEGDEAWSGECGKDRFILPTVKAKVFDRIKADLSSSYNLEYSLLPSSSPEHATHTPSCLPLIDLVPQQMALNSTDDTGGANNGAADPISMEEVESALNNLQVE